MQQDNKLIRSVVATAQTGNGAALQQLFSISADRVYAIILGILLNDEEAEKLTLEILINALHTISKVQEDEIYSLWLTQMTIRTILSKVNNKEIKVGHKGFTVEEVPAEYRQGKRFVGNVGLEESIRSLPLQERIAFVLNELGGCSAMDISGILNLSYEETNDMLIVTKGLVIADFKNVGNTEEDFEYAEKFFRTEFVLLQKKINPLNDLWPSVKQAIDELRIKNIAEFETKGVESHFGDSSRKEVKAVDKGELKKKIDRQRLLEEVKSKMFSDKKRTSGNSIFLFTALLAVIIILILLTIYFT